MRLRLGDVEHDLTTHALVMGVLAPAGASSFDGVLARAEQMVADGADLLDLGGARAGPGGHVGEDEELAQLVPAVAALRSRFDVGLSVETWRAPVLAGCVAAGAVVGIDLSGFTDDAFLPTAARVGATVIATSARLRPAAAAGSPPSDVVSEVRAFLASRVEQARGAGLADERILVDAGLGLGKTPAQSLTLLRESAEVADLGPALVLRASGHRFLERLLDLEPDQCRGARAAAAALGMARGCRVVRTSDVRGARRAADVLEALLTARLAEVGRRG